MAAFRTAAGIVLGLVAWLAVEDPPASSEPTGPYADERDHPLNRFHRALFHRRDVEGRPHGVRVLDPLLFAGSVWPLEAERARELEAALEGLIDAPASFATIAPLQRLVVQRDLWALHDWAAARARAEGADAELAAELRERSARGMRAMALAPDELTAANAAASALLHQEAAELRELLLPGEASGPWIALVDLDQPGRPLASAHSLHFDARSVFEGHLRHPGGRAAGERYLADLRQRPLATRTEDEFFLPPDLLQPPPGTRVALVRRAVHLTAAGTATQTELVELVQLRTFLRTDVPGSLEPEALDSDPTAPEFWAEFQSTRALGGRSRAIAPRVLEKSDTHASVSARIGSRGPALTGALALPQTRSRRGSDSAG